MPLSDFHSTVTFTSAFVVALLSALLMGVPISSSDQRLTDFRRARGYLVLSFWVMSGADFWTFWTGDVQSVSDLGKVVALIVCYFQALLFLVTIIVFIQPRFVNRRFVMGQLLLLGAISAVLLFCTYLLSESWFDLCFYLGVGAYGVLLIYYTALFRRQYALCLAQLEAYYDEDENNRLRWVSVAFYGALVIGVLALCSLFLPMWFVYLFIAMYVLFYTYMVNRFYCYQLQFKFVIPVIARQERGNEPHGKLMGEERSLAEDLSFEVSSQVSGSLREALSRWVEEKRFTRGDVGVEETALELGTNIQTLRNYFKRQMGVDFRTWRLQLRLDEALRLMDEFPDLPINEINERVGINDRSNFHRQFVRMVGVTPADYRRQLKERS